MAIVGASAFAIVRDGGAPPTTTTTTSTTSRAELVDAIAGSIRDRLEVPLTAEEGRCLAEAVLGVLGPDELAELPGSTDPLADLDASRRAELLRGVVSCLPADAAARLLGSSTTAPAPAELPDEGQP